MIHFGEYIIEQPNVNDAEEMIDYLKIICGESPYLRFFPDEINLTVDEEKQFIERFQKQQNSNLVVARYQQKIVAIASLDGLQMRKFYHSAEFGVSVLKEHWHKGLGKFLTKYMINWTKENDHLTRIFLHVHSGNKHAVKLYQDLGFEIEGIQVNDFYYDNTYFDTLFMGINML